MLKIRIDSISTPSGVLWWLCNWHTLFAEYVGEALITYIIARSLASYFHLKLNTQLPSYCRCLMIKTTLATEATASNKDE